MHGDFKLDNVLVLSGHRESEPFRRSKAVLDWEMATVGDPLADVGYLLAFWVEADDPPWRVMPAGGIYSAPGMPTRNEVVAWYGERTGLHAGREV